MSQSVFEYQILNPIFTYHTFLVIIGIIYLISNFNTMNP